MFIHKKLLLLPWFSSFAKQPIELQDSPFVFIGGVHFLSPFVGCPPTFL
jgi:hypothetical protein